MRCAALVFLALAPIQAGCRTVAVSDPRIERAEAMTRVGAWGDAAALWNEIYLSSGTRNIDAGLRSAEAFEEKGELSSARARLVQLEKRAPERADVALALGRVMEQLGEAEEARVRYGRAVELDPTAAEARRGLGRLTAGEEGLGALREALRLEPGDVATRRALGLGLAEAGELDAAAAHLDAGFRAGLGDSLLDGERLRAARAFGADPRVIPWLEPVAARAPEATEVLRRIGEAHLAAGRAEAASRWLERAASSDPTDGLALVSYARAALGMGDVDRARWLVTAAGSLPLTALESAALAEVEKEVVAATRRPDDPVD